MKVALIMGSKSDLPVALKAMEMLDKFGVPYSARVISAHRALDMLTKCVNSFEKDAVKVVIALAGKAAHLPGVIAGMTTLPVIGVPIKGSAFLGMDSLLSIVQMPTGVPVATVAVDAADNAAILACQILALNSPELKQKLLKYKRELAKDVAEQDRSIQ
ncbi:MAG TPA: 5-(carboxyamino)imidazole ribonucleotide mutase [Anaerolineaceae bacterium]|nr:5-(carboxyamino)imidazole ribonucleotide mutase [Anaerolineaceae bacterium]